MVNYRVISTEQQIDEQRLKDLEKTKCDLEDALESKRREVEEGEAKYSKAFVEYQVHAPPQSYCRGPGTCSSVKLL